MLRGAAALLAAASLLQLPALAPAAINDTCWVAQTAALVADEGMLRGGPAEAAGSCQMIGCVHPDGLPEAWSQEYPLQPDMLARSIPYSGNTRRLQEILQKAAAGSNLTAVALGGSVTMGAHTEAMPLKDTWPQRSWVARMEAWLRRRFPTAGITVHNAARSGCTSLCQRDAIFDLLPPHLNPDIVLIDTSSNDAYSGSWAGPEGVDLMSGAMEVVLRHALKLESAPAVIYMEAFIPDPRYDRYKDYFWSVQDWVRPIVEPYGAHMVSYRDAVWPVYEERSPALQEVFWENLPDSPDDSIHPSWRAHQLYADMLAHFLDAQYVEACKAQEEGRPPGSDAHFRSASEAPLLPQTAPMEHLLCDGNTPSTLFDVHRAESLSSVSMIRNTSWAIYAESKKRPGFIGFGSIDPHAVLEVELKCRKHAQLAITFLESYEQVGAVQVMRPQGTSSTKKAAPVAGPAFKLEAAGSSHAGSAQGMMIIDALNLQHPGSSPKTVYVQLDDTFMTAEVIGDDALQAAAEHATDVAVVLYRVALMLLGPDDFNMIYSRPEQRPEDKDAHMITRGGWKFKLLGLACC
eukprot:TRINITY_DN3403_c0_g1_i1.p1 TRINITY_DN3403_c0_g1~~TRINITY_DN3403_c0_g1_i1.p1  ORF type:complete len:575 (+),score=86.34 TRINITY_DN3403_c0_g1_i1:258-1982(+)